MAPLDAAVAILLWQDLQGPGSLGLGCGGKVWSWAGVCVEWEVDQAWEGVGMVAEATPPLALEPDGSLWFSAAAGAPHTLPDPEVASASLSLQDTAV